MNATADQPVTILPAVPEIWHTIDYSRFMEREGIEPCPECDTPTSTEVGERCSNPDCDHVVPEPEPYAVTFWR